MKPQEIDNIKCAIRHIELFSNVDPWAAEIAVEAMKAQLSKEDTTSDLISRQAAIDAECEVCQIAPKKERGHNCTYYVHGCKEIECLRELPSAHPEIEERTEEFAQNVPKEDLISRKAAIDVLDNIKIPRNASWYPYYQQALTVMSRLPSVQPEIIRCKDCENWIPGYITDNDDFIPPKCGKYQQMVGHSSDDYCSLAERRTDE